MDSPELIITAWSLVTLSLAFIGYLLGKSQIEKVIVKELIEKYGERLSAPLSNEEGRWTKIVKPRSFKAYSPAKDPERIMDGDVLEYFDD